MTAIISWLYERTLSRAHERLRLAQERILHDELVRRDLEIARDLQQRLYPEPPKGHSQVTIASRSEPARETSGDFYDFIELGDNQLGIVIADVTGKSLAAALVMAMVRSTFRCEAHHSQSPAEVLRRVNELLCLDHSVKQMVTAWYGVLDTRSLLLRAANAGHPFPMLLRDGKVSDIEAVGLPLRAQPGTIYAEHTTQLHSADLLVLLSDGLVEAMNGSRELFGFDRFAASLEHQSALRPQELIDHLWRQIDAFRGEVEQNDDMTLVVVGCERVSDEAPVAAPSQALAVSQPTGAP
ncbi:MAG TPA: PP2C family protein-serine/threonine phosphatase [Herpetosiphonaceae bacterium]